jgi:Uma2 family endonuclease
MSAVPKPEVFYPSSDGKGMAENTIQFRWIQVLSGNLAALFQHAPDVFVGGDLLWYHREGDNTLCQAPDVFAVFGRPKGDRLYYKQWEEGGVPMTVAFEILSPGNNPLEMADKLAFYDEYGVEEYYIFNPDNNEMQAYRRGQAALRRLPLTKQYTSPRLGVRFDLTGEEMVVFYPDGRRFLTFEQHVEQAEAAQQQLTAVQEALAVTEEQAKANEELAAQAQQHAAEAQQQAAQAEQRLARMAFLVQRVLAGQATPEEAQELQQLSQAAGT